jgi:hypothetical protein
MSNYVAPTGYVDLDNDCNYSLDLKSTRSRESVNPKEDLAFYFETYIVPKYGLNNLNVNNVASFMKDLEMNWTKIDPSLKGKVLDIMVDGILSKNSNFKQDLLAKLGVNEQAISTPSEVSPPQAVAQPATLSSFKPSKSGFGESASSGDNIFLQLGIGALIVGFIFVILNSINKNKTGGYPRFR